MDVAECPEEMCMPGYVFISYSHEPPDAAYVARLADALIGAGVAVWYDRELGSGDRWKQVLRDRVDGCAALVVVMSPAAEASRWVRLEVGRARYRGRAVHPILLEGKGFGGLADLQYETVPPGGIVPSTRFVDRLRALVTGAGPPQPASGAGEVVGRGFPVRNPHFVGRSELLLDLESGLYWGASVAVEALHGTGGVGKTQLAAEYVYRRRGDYDLIAWINAERGELIPDQLAALAPVLEVPTMADVPATAQAVIAALGGRGLRWLLVFDNADLPADVLGWLPRSGGGHVIVTSRRTGWDALGAKLDIDVLSTAEAISLLRQRISTVDDAVAGEIVERLGRLPLAVEQAAAYLAETGTPTGDYLRLLHARGEELLDRGDVLGYDHTVATVWEVSRASLSAASPAAEQLLRLCAFLGPEPIPLDLFSRHADLLPSPLLGVTGDELRFGETVGALVARSLARRSIDGLSVHRLLASVVRHSLTDPDRHATVATMRELLYQHLPDDIENSPQNWPVWRALLPHVLAAINHASPHLGDQDRTARLLNRASTYLHTQGQPAAAQPLLERALHINETSLGRDHPYTLTSRNNLAYAYASAGQFSRAIPLYEATLADRLRVLGPDHPDTLGTRNNLAYAYTSAGQSQRAIPLYEATLADQLRVLGPDHPDTLTVRNNLAGAYGRVGQLQRAIPVYEATLADRLRVLGPDHPDTLGTRNNLAYAYTSAGQSQRAIPLYEATLADRLRVLGPDHPDTLQSRNNLADAYGSAGQWERAIQLYEATLVDCERVLGLEHPGTLTLRDNLAGAYESAGQLERAIPLYEATLADALRILGPAHPFTEAVLGNLRHARGWA
jgi:tetratricopeptide (TPR) repeat protein